jgi:hypothetical protein
MRNWTSITHHVLWVTDVMPECCCRASRFEAGKTSGFPPTARGNDVDTNVVRMM